jgi:hypothetical protein
MKLFTKAQETKLRANFGKDEDIKPVVKLFNPVGSGTWLLTELAPNGIAFGLCDLGFGSPELGYVDIEELRTTRLRFGLSIERDLHFKATKTIGEYANQARQAGAILA